MIAVLRRWLQRKWQRKIPPSLAISFYITFSTPHGQRVLQHLLDNIYFQVHEGTDPQAALAHNARRSVVQEILENIHLGESPQEYELTEEKEKVTHG